MDNGQPMPVCKYHTVCVEVEIHSCVSMFAVLRLVVFGNSWSVSGWSDDDGVCKVTGICLTVPLPRASLFL